MAQIVVASAWSAPFHWVHNTISDLGNTACGDYAGRLVCSLRHALMNWSFLAVGLGMAVGAWMVQRQLGGNGWQRRLGFCCLILAGFGTYLVGIFPEDTVAVAHIFGAGLALSLGNIFTLKTTQYWGVPA